MTTETITLASFLLARIADDEAIAQNATPGCWKLWGMTVMADQDGTSNVETAAEVAHTSYRDEHGMPRTWDAAHIARHDPARVLAECAAKRAIVEMLAESELLEATGDPASWAVTAQLETVARTLAAVYSDHPDYSEDWRP